jgi:branched-chain amino acid transport system permease protein
MAVGLTLIFGVMRVVNFAHGDMMVWGMYLALMLSTRVGLDPYVSFVVCAAALFGLGVVVQRGLVDRIIDAPHEMQILLMLGLALVLENLALVAFGPEPVRVRSPLSAATLWIGPLYVDVARLVTFAVALVLTLGLYLFLFRTELGRLIRASADNTYGAQVIGADVRRSMPRPSASAPPAWARPARWSRRSCPSSPQRPVAVGGLLQHRDHRRDGQPAGRLRGWAAGLGGRSLGAVFIKPSLKELFSFSLLIVILLFRPAGLFGKRAS